jgi:hypothetical protein
LTEEFSRAMNVSGRPGQHDAIGNQAASHARNAGLPLRLVIRSVCGSPNLSTSSCTRTLWPDGALTEVVHLDGGRDGLSDEDLETFIASFPVQRGVQVPQRGRLAHP